MIPVYIGMPMWERGSGDNRAGTGWPSRTAVQTTGPGTAGMEPCHLYVLLLLLNDRRRLL